MEKSCGVVLFRRTSEGVKYLLLGDERGNWGFPKGHVKGGESEERTARRELLEEAGISSVDLFEGFRQTFSYYFKKEGELVHKQVVFFLGETKDEDVKISGEHTGHRWVNFSEGIKPLSFKNAKVLLKSEDRFVRSRLFSYG